MTGQAPSRVLWQLTLSAWPCNLECYYLPLQELERVVLDRVAQAAPGGRGLAFEISEQYPDNWVDSILVVLQALKQTRV